MGNAESAPVVVSPGGSTSSGDDRNYWHGTQPGKEPSLRQPPKMALQRKGSSFLDEPVTHKLTERGEASITVMPDRGATAEGREGADLNVETFPSDSRVAENKMRYAVSEMQGWRSHMEDKHAMNPPLFVNSQQKRLLRDHHLFAVFDGHGGDYASHLCGEHIVSTLTAQKDWQRYLKLSASAGEDGGDGKAIAATPDSVMGLSLLKSALQSTFLALDAKLLSAQRRRRVSQLSQLEDLVYSLGGTVEHDVFHKGTKDHERILSFDGQLPSSMPANVPLERSGSTGVVVLVTPSHIICANAGDSRAILSRRSNGVILSKDGVLPLSFDHKPSNDVEVSRVERGGGFIRNGRVNGDLAVSRSFGDFGYKQSNNRQNSNAGRGPQHAQNSPTDDHVSVCPDILVQTRDPARDEFIVLACDGIWDRLTNRDCADLVRKLIREEEETDVGLLCEEVMDTALELDSRDNMTVCVVVFPGAGVGESPSKPQRTNSGVLRRRSIREAEWGDNSTPAKRALRRLEERKKKNREIIALQRSKGSANANVPKSQVRRMGRQGPGLQMSPSSESSASGGSRASRSQVHPTGSGAGSGGRKHKAAQSPPRETPRETSRIASRTRSGKALRLQVSGSAESNGSSRQ